MSTSIRVYSTDRETVFPADSHGPPAYVDDLIRNDVDLYVDTGRAEVIASIPSRTTLLAGDRMDFFYHYDSDDSTAMMSEFRTLLEVLHEDDISDGGTDCTEEAKQGDVPESVVETGIFEVGWYLIDAGPSSRLVKDLTDAEAAFPGLNRLQREVLTSTLGEERLVLGIENYESGLQAIQYLVQNGHDARVAIAPNDDTTALSSAELVLTPGTNRNFEPLDSESATTLNDRTGEKIENWTAELKADADAAIERLVAESDRSDYAIYRDLRHIETQITDEEEVDFDSGDASEVVDIHESVETSQHLTAEDRTEITQTILQRVEEAQETVAGRIRSEKLPALEDALATLIDSIDNPFDVYNHLKVVERIVAVDYEHNLPDLDSPPPGLESFREEWRELLIETQPDDPVREDIRAEIGGTIVKGKTEIEDTLTTEATKKLDAELRRLGDKHRQEPRRFIREARTIGQAIDGKETDDLPKQTERELQPIIDVVTDEDYDEGLRQELKDRLHNKLSGQLLEAYTASVESLVEDVHRRSSDPQTALAQLRDVVENGTLDSQPVNDPALEDAIEYVQEAYDDEYLRQHDEDAFRNDIEGLIDDLTSERKGEYEKRFTSLIEGIDINVSIPERKVEIYDTFIKIIENEGSESSDASAKERAFAEDWRKMLDDDSLSSSQKVELAQEIKSLIEERRIRASRPLSSGSEATDGSRFPRSITIGSRTIPTIPLLLGVLVLLFLITESSAILVLSIAVFIVFLIGVFRGSSDAESEDVAQPQLEIEVPSEGSVLDTELVPFRGEASGDALNTEFDSIHSNRVLEGTVEISDGSFDETATLPVGIYRLEASTDDGATETLTFAYHGDDDTTLSITAVDTTDSVEGYEMSVMADASGRVDRISVTLFDDDGTHVDSRRVELDETGEFGVLLETSDAGMHVVEVAAPHVSVDRLRDRQIVDVG